MTVRDRWPWGEVNWDSWAACIIALLPGTAHVGRSSSSASMSARCIPVAESAPLLDRVDPVCRIAVAPRDGSVSLWTQAGRASSPLDAATAKSLELNTRRRHLKVSTKLPTAPAASGCKARETMSAVCLDYVYADESARRFGRDDAEIVANAVAGLGSTREGTLGLSGRRLGVRMD